MSLRDRQAAPVYEHIADMQAMAIGSTWNIRRKDGTKIRDWQDPETVTSYGSLQTRFPATFDELNYHGVWGGYITGWYMSWHVGSTVWSHLVYNLAQQPGVGRQLATEVVYRTLVNRMENDDDFSFTGYAHHMRLEADTMGLGNAVRDAQLDAELWMPAEIILPDCYTRPAIISGVERIDLGGDIYLIIPTLMVFYNEVTWDTSPPGDRLMQARKDGCSGPWDVTDTGIPSPVVSGAIAAAYDSSGNQYFLAFTAMDGSIRYTRRSDLQGSSWDSLASLPYVTTQHDVALAAGNGHVRLYFVDSDGGRLSYFRWQGTGGWSTTPVPAPIVQIQAVSGPRASWDGSYFQVVWLGPDDNGSNPRTARIYEVEPKVSADTWHRTDIFQRCWFDTLASDHQWAETPAGAVANGKLYLVGPTTNLIDGLPDVHQAAAEKAFNMQQGNWYWSFLDHASLERVSHGVDVAPHCNSLYAVGYLGFPEMEASVYYKKP
jgi:hypothetical protein